MKHFILLSLLSLSLQQPSLPAASVSGTYDILICKGPCGFNSPENVLVRGSLILEAQPFQRPAPSADPFDFDWLWLGSGGTTNACFVLETLERNRTYAGLTPVGFTRWSLDGEKVSFPLFRSPDAGHTASVTLSEQGFQGTGTSRGAGVAAPPSAWQPDTIRGRRTGPANTSICTKAVEGKAQRN